MSRVAYKLFFPKGDNLKTHPVVHIANLKKFVENPERFLDREDLSRLYPHRWLIRKGKRCMRWMT